MGNYTKLTCGLARIYIANLWFEKCYFSHLRFTLFNFCNPPLLKTMANLANNWWSSMAETYPERERGYIHHSSCLVDLQFSKSTLLFSFIFKSSMQLLLQVVFPCCCCLFVCFVLFFFFGGGGGQFGDGREGGGGCERCHFWEIALIIGNFMCIAIVHSFLQKKNQNPSFWFVLCFIFI